MSSADGREALTGLKVDDLKRLLRGKGLKVSGLKVDLIDRLLSSQEGGGLHSISRKRSRPGDESKSGTDHEKKKSSLPQRANIPRSVTPRTPATNGSGSDGRSLNIISWNVNGLRARLRSAEGRDALRALAVRESAHLICLQETKLNPENVEEATAALRDILPGFSFHFNCSVAKRGYSGTAVLLSPSVPHEVVTVHSGMGHQESDVEGRCLTVHFPNLSVVNVYVPNSGEGLRRLAFRTDEWDPALASHVQKVAEDRGSPCLLVGDLNVAHQDADFFNPEAPYTTLQACTTPQERESFEKRLLKESNLVDAFRSKYPSATGVYRLVPSCRVNLEGCSSLIF
jgi:exodeoxyribonuclease-3